MAHFLSKITTKMPKPPNQVLIIVKPLDPTQIDHKQPVQTFKSKP